MFIEADAGAKAPVLWPILCEELALLEETLVLGGIGGWGGGMVEGGMAGWHRRLDGHGFGWAPGIGDGRGSWRAAVVHGVVGSRTH